MKYTVHYGQRFKKSLKKVRQLPGFKPERLKQVIAKLANGEPLPAIYKDHQLTGNMRSFRECHLSPDILLIYQIDNDVVILTLVNIGSHSKLFE